MMNKNWIVLVFLFVTYTAAVGQGCSDAGACNLIANRSVGHDFLKDSVGFKLYLGSSYAKGEQETTIITPYIGFGYKFNREWMVQGRMTANYAGNTYANAKGIADVIVDVNYSAFSWLDFSVGVKLPVSRADERWKENAYTLPMVFQPGVGTTDIMAGVAFRHIGFQAGLGVQLPIDQNNNTFRSIYEETSIYTNTNGFDRRGDALGTLSYSFEFAKGKIHLVPAVRAIYHLGEDRFIDLDGKYQSYTGSEGFTVNGILNAGFNIGHHIGINLFGAVPFVVREIRPDGLTRQFVAGIDIGIQF